MSKPLLQVIIGSTRRGRVGKHVANWFVTAARQADLFEVEVLDLMEIDLPLMAEPNHPSLQQYTEQSTKDWSAAVSRGDAVVFVTPEYNWGTSAALKNAIDHLNKEWAYKAVGIVSYGGVSAGLRAATSLRATLQTLRMFPVADAVSIPMVEQFVTEGTFVPNETLREAVGTMLEELLRVTEATALLRRRD